MSTKSKKQIDYKKDNKDLSISLRNTQFLIKVEELNCGKKKINLLITGEQGIGKTICQIHFRGRG